MCSIALHNENGQVCAVLYNGKLSKRVIKSKHMLRKPQGWAVDLAHLKKAVNLGIQIVEIFDVEDKNTYSAPITLFWEKGVLINRGYGRQRALPLRYWKQRGEHMPIQMDMFTVLSI